MLNELDGKWVNEFSLRETLQQELQRVENENEQLEKENEEFNEELMEYDSFKRLYEEKIKRTEKENEQLKNGINEAEYWRKIAIELIWHYEDKEKWKEMYNPFYEDKEKGDL